MLFIAKPMRLLEALSYLGYVEMHFHTKSSIAPCFHKGRGYIFNSPRFIELSTRFAQNDQPVIHRGVDDKLPDLFRA